jgi:dihydropyrimidine dehydrogenase (NAD+) subunit PreA
VYAGGDCVAPGQDLTVQAVQHGKLAALAIHQRHPIQSGGSMADLSIDFCGIKSPNPFWLASAPPTDKAYNVVRAFEAGWGGVVWKTLGEDPPAVNVSSRYSAHYGKNREVIGFNNIELITDRSLEINLREITQVKKDWPDRAMIVSLMLPCEEAPWARDPAAGRSDRRRRHRTEFRLPARHAGARHGRGGGPGAEYCRDGHALVQEAFEAARHRQAHAEHHRRARAGAGRAGRRRGCGLADQHHQFDHPPRPGPHGGLPDRRRRQHPRRLLRFGGQADRAEHGGRDRARPGHAQGLPISGIGGIGNWRDAAEFIALGAGSVQVCTAAMLHGFRIVEEMKDGLSRWMDEGLQEHRRVLAQGRAQHDRLEIPGHELPGHRHIDQDKCIKCGKCYVACEDTSHQAIAQLVDGNGARTLRGDQGPNAWAATCAKSPARSRLHHDGAAARPASRT